MICFKLNKENNCWILLLGGGKDLATAATIKSTFVDEKPPSTSINTNLTKPLEPTSKMNANNMGNNYLFKYNCIIQCSSYVSYFYNKFRVKLRNVSILQYCCYGITLLSVTILSFSNLSVS